MPASPSSQTSTPAWYIQAAGRVWGPYPYSRMAEFVREGRLSPSSLVGAQPAGPFGAAEFRRELLDLFAPAMPEPERGESEPPGPERREPAESPRGSQTLRRQERQVTKAHRPEPRRSEPQQSEPERAAHPAAASSDLTDWPDAVAPSASPASAALIAPRPMVVWADLASLTPSRFEAVLAAYGPYAAIRPGLWLVQARMSPQALRNALSRRLRTDDALLVLQAPLESVAWFNLTPTADRDLRQLWGSHG